MREIEILLPANVTCEAVEQMIDESIAQSECETTLRGSLKKFPNCVHWHLKRPDSPGTLEITLWPQQHRAWFSIQSGRAAPWIEGAISQLVALLWRRLQGS